ncbi:MAG: glycerol-3-phosphate dehydrogenase/oxidase [Geminicoccaceae bacterium]
MKRDPGRLAGPELDVLVIGGGIYGACIARDAAQRGLRTALVERGDFGGLTSHNSFKLIHGGLRYLQQLDIQRLRQSAREQRIWLGIAPHLVRPLPFVMPTFGHGSRGPEALRLALLAYELLSRGGAPAAPRVPSGRVVGRAEAMALLPGLPRSDLNGAAIWSDVQMLNADRLLLECVMDAAAEGAVVANHVEALGFLGTPERVTGARARDRLGDGELDIRAKLTINAAGPHAGLLLDRLPARSGRDFGGLARGLNIVVRRPLATGHALAVSSRRRSDSLVPRADGRLFFIQPWQGLTLIGTSHLPHADDSPELVVDGPWLDDFLAEINDAWPPAALTREDVLYCYAGLTPAAKEARGSEVARTRRGVVIDHGPADGIQGVLSLQGVKYTTARLVAESVVDLALARLGRPAVPCRSWQEQLPGARGFEAGAALAAARRRAPGGGAEIDRLVADHGAGWAAVLDDAGEGPLTGEAVFRARVRHVVRHEMACRLDDVLVRRLDEVARGRLDRARLDAAAGVMAEELGWSPAERAAAVADLARHGPAFGHHPQTTKDIADHGA